MRSSDVKILPQHEIYRDSTIYAGLTRYPTLNGQAMVEIANGSHFDCLTATDLKLLFQKLHVIAEALKGATQCDSCAIGTDGGTSIVLMPFKRSSIDEANNVLIENPVAGVPISSNLKGRMETYSSMAETDDNTIQENTEGLCSLIWQNKHFKAWVCVSKNAVQRCILRSRKEFCNRSSAHTESHTSEAAYLEALISVIKVLKLDLAVSRCGFTRNDIDDYYSETTLGPFTKDEVHGGYLQSPSRFNQTYAGVVSLRLGPLARDLTAIELLAADVRMLLKPLRNVAPKSWQTPLLHSLDTLRSPWYSSMFELQDTFFHACTDFFRTEMSYKYALVPLTTESISSPMGLGSDSLPVAITLLGSPTYLADSMQFALEYALRLKKDTVGTYYVSPSFRGEEHDATHMNQFYHVECELVGGLDDGMAVMERFVVSVASKILEKHYGVIAAIAGDTKHIESLLERYSGPRKRFPTITLDAAIEICDRDRVVNAWESVLPGAPEKGRKLTRQGEQHMIACFDGFVWLLEMDHLSVPFYQAYADSERKKALCGDLLIGIGETGGLGQRHKTAEEVRIALQHHEVSEDAYDWYMGIRADRELQTVGWGMGMERFMLWLLRHDDVRDIAILPRLKGSVFMP